MRSLVVLAIVAGVLVPASQTHAQERRAKRVGYELLQIKSPNEIIAWASGDITREQFDALKLPFGWFKNQPREIEVDGGSFLNSPGLEEGSYSRAEHFGHEWLHVATVRMAGRKRLDPTGQLAASTVVKDHVVEFHEGSTLTLLVSPEGKVFPRISRDANRSHEDPTLPENWRLIEHKVDRPVEFRLTGETTVIRTDNQDSFQGPVEFSLDQSQPEPPTPSPEEALLLFRMLDQDGDRQVSEDEAMGELQENFGLVDNNGDGGIDPEEFTRGITAGAISSSLAGPSFGTRNDSQWARMRSVSPDEDGEFLMVNLIKFRAEAKYADGRKTNLTGEEANALYAPIKFIAQIGGKVDFAGRVKDQIGNMEPRWDEIGIVRYPSRAKFFEMVTNPEFQERVVHKDAGLEFSQVLLTEPTPWTLTDAKQVADKEDAFTLTQLLKYQEIAQYADTSEVTQNRTGKQAMDAFDAATEDLLREVGAKRVLKSTVEGVLIGDGRVWDEFRMLHFPSEAAYTAYSEAVIKMPDAIEHCDAAIKDSYLMKVDTMPLAKRLAVTLATSVLGNQRTRALEQEASTPQGVRPGVHRTPDARFADIKDFPFKTHYIDIDGLRMAYVDEGTGRNGTFLLLHGEPVWSYMYRGAIPGLAAAGYRVIAPDNIGFGRSDKVIDSEWYTLDNHIRTLKRLVTKLDLRNITIVVNDWGGPNGLVMATEMPNRFDRLVILNTWLHFEGYTYTKALRDWNKRSQRMDFTNFFLFPSAVRAPFDGPEAVAGALRWPWMLPFAEPEAGNAVRQEAAWSKLASWDKPAHVVFGDSDRVFTEEWGRQFAEHIPGATFTSVKGEGHRPLLFTGPAGGQFTGKHRGDEFAELVLRLIRTE